MNVLLFSSYILFSYLLGACPNGLLVSRARGVDIRAVGSGNIGATNVFRSVGKSAGLLVFLLDALKGFIPAFVFPWVAARFAETPMPAVAGLWFGVAAIAGHNWPVYLRFKGGKGVATSAGVLIGVVPTAAGIGLLTWIVLFLSTRYVSVGSLGAAAAVAITGWMRYREAGLTLPIVLTLLALLVVWRHRANLHRLVAGTENRFSFGRKRPPATPPDAPTTETPPGEESV